MTVHQLHPNPTPPAWSSAVLGAHETPSDAVLGCMLTGPREIDDVCEIIHGGDFRDARDELVFDAIVGLHANGHPVDPVTVSDRLAENGSLARAGGAARLHLLVARTSTSVNAVYYARIVRDEAMLRAVTATGVRLTQLGQDGAANGDDALDVVNAARTELDELITADNDRAPNEQAVYDAIAALDEPAGLPSPWPSYTEVIAGFKPGAKYVFGARPGVGKTVVAAQLALDCARRGRTAVMHALEMTSNEMYWRLLSMVGEVAADRIQHRRLTRADHEKLREAAGHIARLGDRLVIDDRGGIGVAQIRAQARAIRRTRELGMVIVDHVGLVAAPANAPRDNREQQVSAVSWGLKLLAKDLEVPVVVMAQLNRQSEARADRRPTLSDLRESGALEQNADVVTLLYRDLGDEVSAARMELITAKNRHGPQVDVELAFQGHLSRLVDVSPQRY